MQRILPLVMLLFVSSLAKAELIFTTPPRGNETEDRAVYEPIAAAMSKWLHADVVYEYPKDFTTYSFRMREGRYDIVLDGSHFAAWRQKKKGHQILASLPEKLVFLTVASNATSITGLDGLVAKRVCAQASPQLGTLFLVSQFPNPAREPIIESIENESKLNDAVKSGKCPVAVIRDKTFLKMTEQDRGKFRVVHSSRPVPNITVSVSANLTPSQKKALLDNLTDAKTAAVMKEVFAKFSKGATHFEPANPAEFEGLDLLLSEHSYGW